MRDRITEETRLEELLAAHPWLRGALPEISGKFRALDSPLGKIMARKATLAQMSRKSGIPAEELIRRLEELLRAHRAPVTADMPMGEILRRHPETAPVLVDCGMHCLGCPASQAESLAEACRVHGLDVQTVLIRLNACIEGA